MYSNDVDTREFSASALSSLPISEAAEWKIDEVQIISRVGSFHEIYGYPITHPTYDDLFVFQKEFKYRADFREETIFSIDPLTARDLDDALSIKPCDDVDGKGMKGWEVSVILQYTRCFGFDDILNFVALFSF